MKKYKRTLVISDIHGMLSKLNELLEVVQYNPEEDLLIILGDFVDRGPQVLETIRKMMELKEKGAIILRGNHEDMFEGALEGLIEGNANAKIMLHIDCGGKSTYDAIKDLSKNELIDIYEFIADLPFAYTTTEYIFVHAGVNAKVVFGENNPDDFLWLRDEFIYDKAYDGKKVIFGHTPTCFMHPDPLRQRDASVCKIWHDPRYNDKIGIDCGAVFGGKLACLELPSMKEFYV